MPANDSTPTRDGSDGTVVVASSHLSLGAALGVNAHAGLSAAATDGARVIFSMQGICVRGVVPEPVSLGFDPDAVEAFIAELRDVVVAARAQAVNWRRCEGCGGTVRVGEPTWPECASDCAE